MGRHGTKGWRRRLCLAMGLGLLLALLFGISPGTLAQELSGKELALEDAQLELLAQDPNLDLGQKLDRVLERYATLGASIAVIQNGEITFTHVYGLRQKDGAPVTPDTAFQVGSISKMVAGMGVMALVEEGLITLDQDLGKALGFSLRNPQYPDTPVTLRQVMSHTAGLRDSSLYQEALLGKGQPLPQLFSGEGLGHAFLRDFEPGTRQQYSNFGGGLAGALIRALTGQALDDALRERLFAPLGITAGYRASSLPRELPLADLYAMPGRRLLKALQPGPGAGTDSGFREDYCFTAGKLIISAPDLAKLLIALCDGGMYRDVRVLRESTVAEMLTPQNHRGSVDCESGRGLYLNILTDRLVQGRTLYGHGGRAYGMLCAAYFDPTDRTGVVMLTNGCNNREGYGEVGMLSRAVTRLCYGALLDPVHVPRDPFLVE